MMVRSTGDSTYSLKENIFSLNPTTTMPIHFRGNHWRSGNDVKFIINPWIHNQVGSDVYCEK
jgi:hypothetical protein